MDDKAAKILRNLQKLPANKRCFNCESLGPGYVVPQFNVFVCTDCSGIHMHTGHRVKSIAMAKFTPEEVKRLQEGGNENTARSYLARWKPETDTQKPVDRNPKRVQQWIKVVFTDRAYYSEVAPAPAPIEVATKLEEPPKLVAPTSAPLRTSPPAPTTPPSKPEVSLLDFGSEPAPVPVKGPEGAAAPSLFDPFAAPAASSTAATSVPAPAAFDPFGNSAPFNSAPAAAAAAPAPSDPFSTAPTASAAHPASSVGAGNSTFGSSFDPFNNGDAPSSWPSSASAAPMAAPPASDWTSFDTSSAFPYAAPAATSVPSAAAAVPVGVSHPIRSGPQSSLPLGSSSSTPTAAGHMDAFGGQHAFSGPAGLGPVATQSAAAFHPSALHPGYAAAQFPAAGPAAGEFGRPPFSAPSSAPTTPTSAAEKAARNELPSDLFAEAAFPAQATPGYGAPQPNPQMGYAQMGYAQMGYAQAPSGGMPAYNNQQFFQQQLQQQLQQQQQQGFGLQGQFPSHSGFAPDQVMPGYNAQHQAAGMPPAGGSAYGMPNQGSAFLGMAPAFQQPSSSHLGTGPHAGGFFPPAGAPFTGQQANQMYGGMAGNPYAGSASSFSQHPQEGAPAASNTPAAVTWSHAPKKADDDLAFADLLGDMKKALPKSAGPSTPSYSTGGFGAATASSGNPFA